MDKEAVKKEVLSIAKDVALAALVVCLVLGSVVVYTGNWPPLVVVESGSMMHTDGPSLIGVIDPGDLVLVKKVHTREDVVTYVEGAESVHVSGVTQYGVPLFNKNVSGRKAPHSTYGGEEDVPGDVIVYYKNGIEQDTPIIHRAILWVEYNDTLCVMDNDPENGSFDIPDLNIYGFRGALTIYDVGYRSVRVEIDLSNLLSSGFTASGSAHGGFITLGDHNGASYDQGWLNDVLGRPIEPVRVSWILGKARGEMPWFGAIKLYFGDDQDKPGVGRLAVPPNSWKNLFLTVAGLIGLAIFMDFLTYYIGVRRKGKEEEEGEEEGDAENDAEDEENKEGEEGEGEWKGGEEEYARGDEDEEAGIDEDRGTKGSEEEGAGGNGAEDP